MRWAYLSSRTSAGIEPEPPRRSPDHVPPLRAVSSCMLGDPGKDNGNKSTPMYRKRQREAERRGGDSPSVSSSGSVKVIDLTNYDDADDLIPERLYKPRSGHVDGLPRKKQPSKRPSKNRHSGRQRQKVKAKEQAGPGFEIP